MPVVTLSCTEVTTAHELANKNVPGSISSFNSRPVSAANDSNASLTRAPTTARSVELSYDMRPTLYPPPRLSVVTVGNSRHRSSDIPLTFCHRRVAPTSDVRVNANHPEVMPLDDLLHFG